MALDETLRSLILHLAGDHRDRTRLAKLLGITEATAYGWISLTQDKSFGAHTTVRGQANREAKSRLEDLAAQIERGELTQEDAEALLRRQAQTADEGARTVSARDGSLPPERDGLRRGLTYALTQLDAGAPTEQVIASVRTILAMYGGDAS
jgi:hypothetical protein